MPATNTLPTGINDRPSVPLAALIGLQHLLAVFGGIVAAPLLIAIGMGLPAQDTTYLISSALVISGFATVLQISRIGPIGSGLLSIQGTSFTFVGPLIYLYKLNAGQHDSATILGMIFAACAVCSIIIMALSPFVRKLSRVMTTNVAGTTVLLLGITLVWATLNNIRFDVQNAIAQGLPGWPPVVLAVSVFLVIALIARCAQPLLRMSSIVIGLSVGFALAAAFGMIDTNAIGQQERWFFPEFMRYPLHLDLSMVAVLLPIFIVSSTESIGDLTATASLSKLPIDDAQHWRRLRGGILADAINSAIAALFATFPNTTFSQNNGVIRLTGICSRYIGFVVALYLIAIGLLPTVAAGVQILPGSVVAGATLLMFIMVGVSGLHIVRSSNPQRRDIVIVVAAILIGLGLSVLGPGLDMLPAGFRNFVSFPVSSGAFAAAILELVIPHSTSRERPA